MTRKITVLGHSDDLVIVEGDIAEEFTASTDDSGDLLAFSDGTVLRIRFTDEGVWRVTLVAQGSCQVESVAAPEGDEENYSDRVTITGPVDWVVFGSRIERPRRELRSNP